jgi:methionyl aminopeptidase
MTKNLFFSPIITRSLFRKARNIPTKTYDIITSGAYKINTLPRIVPKEIPRPNHIYNLVNGPYQSSIIIKNQWQLEGIRAACRRARTIIDTVSESIQAGITTDTIDKLVHDLCISLGCYPAPLHYETFPRSCCTSVNNIALHGIPDGRPLKVNDILKLDVSVYYNGFFGDVSETYLVPGRDKDKISIDNDAVYLITHARRCRDRAIAVCRPGIEFSAIGRACEEYIKQCNGLNLVRSACGHGLGEQLHEAPQVLHYYDSNEKQMKWIMQEGMVFAIEPVITEGNGRVKMCDDDIQVCTIDNSRCAQFEHTIAITSDGHEILTEGKTDMRPNVLERKAVFV